MSNNLKFVISPKVKDLGDDFKVRRSLPDSRQKMIGPFIFWDHMGPVELVEDKELKVRAHPHIGLATITYLFSGEIFHRDSLGNEQPIKPGEVNWMTAGRGIVHSERARFSEPTILEGIQLWLALPKDKESIEPSFVHHKEKDLPKIVMGDTQLRLIAGSAFDQDSPIAVYSDLFYMTGFTKKGAKFNHKLKSHREAGLYIIKGSLTLEGQSFKRFDMLVFNIGADIDFTASEDLEFMFFGGEPFKEKRFIWWNFVSTDPNLIEKAKTDWKNGGFDKVVNEGEMTPLPES